MQQSVISWGIIGCGNVTEVKSGPAFSLVGNSRLVAVMRRDAAKAADYARRHQVPKWYSDARDLLDDPDINAVYVATPPHVHEDYVIQALQAGKAVYVEKPVSTSVAACRRMIAAAERYGGKLCVAHYRRALPKFLALQQLLTEGVLGRVKMIQLRLFYPHRRSGPASTSASMPAGLGAAALRSIRLRKTFLAIPASMGGHLLA